MTSAARLPQLRRQRACVAAAVVAAVLLAGCAAAQPTGQQDSESATARGPAPVGACVALHGDGSHEPLSAAQTGCDEDMTYTVAAHTDITGSCPPPDTTVFVEPFGDRLTAQLCVIPNLRAGQCYAFAIPTGIYEQAPCTDAAAAHIRIEERVEVSDANACTDPRPSRAMVFHAVPRTYCLSYPGIDK